MLAFKNLFKPKAVEDCGQYGLELAPTGLTMVHVGFSNEEKPTLEWCESRDDNQDNWGASLAEIGKIHPFSSELCSITLHPKFYQFMLIDAPDVEDDELQEAVKWRVSDLVDKPIDEVVVEVLGLPADAYRGRMKMVYVAIVPKTLIREIVTMLDDQGLAVQSISVAELSLMEYMKWLNGYEDLDVALIQIGKDAAQICLMEHRQVYMARAIEMTDEQLEHFRGSDNKSSETRMDYENIVLDIQRSLDYYESQLGKPGIEMAFIFAPHDDAHVMLDYMSEQLNIPLTEFPFDEIIVKGMESVDIEALAGRETLALGAALGGCHHHYETSD